MTDMAQADKTLRSTPKGVEDGIFERHRARVMAMSEEQMKTITVEIQVPDDYTEHRIEQIRRDAKSLADPEVIAIFWSAEDVRWVRPDLSIDQACKVLAALKRTHDATVGISWETLASVANHFYGVMEG